MTITSKILLTGATGNIGSAVLDRLGSNDVDLRVLTRDRSTAQALTARGVEAAVGDFLEPDTLGPALASVTHVFLLTPICSEQVLQACNVIRAAKESGHAPRIVRVSVQQASHEAPTRVARQHAAIEDALRASGLPYTLIRPQSLMQNTLMFASTVAAEGKFYQPFKAGKVGMIDARDVGEVAAKLLTEPGHDNKIYTLTGPAAISLGDVAQALSEVLGKDVRYVDVSLEAAKAAMLRHGVPEWLADALNEYAQAHSEGYSDFTTDAVEQLTGHPATSYRQFACDFEQRFRGSALA